MMAFYEKKVLEKINSGEFRNMLEKNGYSTRTIGYIVTTLSKDLDLRKNRN